MVGETIPLDLMPSSQGPGRDHPALPDRPVAGDQPVQLPAQPGRPQGRAGDRVGLPDRAQAAVQGPARRCSRSPRSSRRPALPEGAVSDPADDPRARRPDGRGRALQAADVHRQSPSVGWRMKERAGKKKVVLELGGNAGVIVDKTADLDWAVRRTLVGAFAYAGQVCISVQRMFVHEDIWDAFMDAVRRGRHGPQGRRPARRDDRRRADGRRSAPRRGPSAGSTRRSRWAARSCSAARPTARSSRRRS